MLKKLLKYDLKALYKSLIPIYATTLILSVTMKILDIIQEKITIFSFMYGFTLMVFILALFVTFLYTFFVSVRHYYNNILKDAAYLTHTLPVGKGPLVLSQCIAAFITFTTSILIIVVALLIPFYRVDLVKDVLTLLALGIEGVEKPLYYMSLFVVLMLSYIEYIVAFMLALSLGHSKISNKIVNSLFMVL